MGPSPLQQPHVVPRPLGALEVRELPLFGVCAGFGVRLARVADYKSKGEKGVKDDFRDRLCRN